MLITESLSSFPPGHRLTWLKNLIPIFVFSKISNKTCNKNNVFSGMVQKYATMPTAKCKSVNWSKNRYPIYPTCDFFFSRSKENLIKLYK